MEYQARLINTITGQQEAGVSGSSWDDVVAEIKHYWLVYSQDGPYRTEIKHDRGKCGLLHGEASDVV